MGWAQLGPLLQPWECHCGNSAFHRLLSLNCNGRHGQPPAKSRRNPGSPCVRSPKLLLCGHSIHRDLAGGAPLSGSHEVVRDPGPGGWSRTAPLGAHVALGIAGPLHTIVTLFPPEQRLKLCSLPVFSSEDICMAAGAARGVWSSSRVCGAGALLRWHSWSCELSERMALPWTAGGGVHWERQAGKAVLGTALLLAEGVKQLVEPVEWEGAS